MQVNDRAAVNQAYWTRYADKLSVRTGFTGLLANCSAGMNSAASLRATQRAVNLMRSLNQLDPIRFTSKFNQRSLRSALMMAANTALNHFPPSNWRCYTTSGARNAARANLGYQAPQINPVEVVKLYMNDDGDDNQAVGHRRWLLYPFTTQMGSGTTQTTNAITVVGPTSRSRHNPAWVSWPSRGWFPNSLEPNGRWSLSSGNPRADFRHARIRVHTNGKRVAVTKLPVSDGYGMPALVWQMHGPIHRTATYTVVVSGVRVNGKSVRHAYRVHLFTPTR